MADIEGKTDSPPGQVGEHRHEGQLPAEGVSIVCRNVTFFLCFGCESLADCGAHLVESHMPVCMDVLLQKESWRELCEMYELILDTRYSIEEGGRHTKIHPSICPRKTHRPAKKRMREI